MEGIGTDNDDDPTRCGNNLLLLELPMVDSRYRLLFWGVDCLSERK
jgi:hypothetical protein